MENTTEEKIWVRLTRESTDSWLETHIKVQKWVPRSALFDFLEAFVRKAYQGWEVVTYCVPEYQGPNGRPADEEDGEIK